MMVRVTCHWHDIQHQLIADRAKLCDEALHDRDTEFRIAIGSFACQLIERSAGAKEAGQPRAHIGVMHVRAGILHFEAVACSRVGNVAAAHYDLGEDAYLPQLNGRGWHGWYSSPAHSLDRLRSACIIRSSSVPVVSSETARTAAVAWATG